VPTLRDEVTYEQDYRTSQFFLRAIVRPVYGHPKKLHGPRIAPMPVRVIPQSMVGPGFLAHTTDNNALTGAAAWTSRIRHGSDIRKNARCCC